MAISTKKYLDYLDKEMTIMGVLSAFAVTTPGLVIANATGAENTKPIAVIWERQQWLFLLGSFFFLVSALYFYRQRSRLAWFAGQIALSESLDQPISIRRDLMISADAWSSWIPYRWGFLSLYTAFFQYGLAFCASGSATISNFREVIALSCVTVTLLAAAFYWYALTKFAHCERPFRGVLLTIGQSKTCGCQPPC